MATTFLNGQFVDASQAMVSGFDAGLQHGVGLFETMTGVVVRAGASATTREELHANFRVIHLHEHMTRLVDSAKALGLSDSLRRDALGEAVERTLAKASEAHPDVERFRIRLTITGGDLNMLARSSAGPGAGSGARDAKAQREQLPTILIHAQPATQYPAEFFERGVGVMIADLKVNPLNTFEGHKTLNYWPRLRALQLASASGASEALVFQVTNHLAGACVSNAILVKNGIVITPWAQGEREALAAREEGVMGEEDAARGQGAKVAAPTSPAGPSGARLPSPVLPGVTRRWALEWCEAQDITVSRKMVTIDDVLGADEVMLTNSSWGVLPVVAVEKHKVGEGRVGALTRRLVEAWQGVAGGS
jgi:branched-chain amino acid aminotransferase